MPRSCLACSSPEREAIDKALVTGEPLRNIAKLLSISPAGLLRHKNHVAQTIMRASEKREEQLDLFDEQSRSCEASLATSMACWLRFHSTREKAEETFTVCPFASEHLL